MAIRVVEDVVVPAAVVAVDMASETWAPTWNEWLAYAAAIGGYVGAAMNFGGDAVKNAGIASLDWAAKKARDRFMSMGTARRATRSVNYRSVSRPAGGLSAPVKPEFTGVIQY